MVCFSLTFSNRAFVWLEPNRLLDGNCLRGLQDLSVSGLHTIGVHVFGVSFDKVRT